MSIKVYCICSNGNLSLFPYCLMYTVFILVLCWFWFTICEICKKSESRRSGKLNPRKIYKFLGRANLWILILEKFSPINVVMLLMFFEIINDHAIRDFVKKLPLIKSFEAAWHSHSRTKCLEKIALINTEMHSELCQTFKMEFVRSVVAVNHVL